ncbi:hypothetical protein BC831DRAFT_479550 [Entophlyctis helioformis]|nr:hypothetical protein BC831DRAFT_479550 [Entophlyctis helioformis]
MPSSRLAFRPQQLVARISCRGRRWHFLILTARYTVHAVAAAFMTADMQLTWRWSWDGQTSIQSGTS